ncbi:DUF1819 domain-containing protein [Endozoicomonas sp. OPT23]|uniref:BrxA family protein n=1 Tax=Endozoicomonas sp. OPT23 TaxID=2072845 RepID=UPI00129BB083|nr:BrxA family protein [Endozoicomonas sp. OPT23]MRI34255.1 DUF1819 domain-containing protein [Endozoicomonas sp. OPT23]
MNARNWLSDLTTGSMRLRESRLIAELLLTNPDAEQWKEQIEARNLLQKSSVHTSIRVALGLRRRLEPMGPDFLKMIVSDDEVASRQLILLAVLVKSPAACHFMSDVLGEARRMYQPQIPTGAWSDFIQQHSSRVEGLEKYSESTLKKAGSNLVSMLVSTGYLGSSRSMSLQTVYPVSEVLTVIEHLGKMKNIQPHWQYLQSAMECTQ